MKEEKEINNTRYYEILETSKWADSTEIRNQYRKLAKKYHPDTKTGDETKFMQVTTAYEVLSDPEKKAVYDKFGEEGVQEQSGGGFERSHDGKGKKCKSRLFTMKITLEDVYIGNMKEFEYSKRTKCEACNGSGSANPAARHECSSCKGKGAKVLLQKMGPMMMQNVVQCEVCSGTGSDIKDKCKTCDAKKVQFTKSHLLVDIEKGSYDGYRYTFYGEGDEHPNADIGDLYIELYLEKHKRFKRDGADLYLKLDISLLETLTGFKRTITHLNGNKIQIETEENETISQGEVRTLKGMGLPFFNSPNKNGNLFIEFNIVFPNEIKSDILESIEKLLPDRKYNKQEDDKEKEKKERELYYLSKYKIEDENTACSGGKTEKESDDVRDDEEEGGDEYGHHTGGPNCQHQ